MSGSPMDGFLSGEEPGPDDEQVPEPIRRLREQAAAMRAPQAVAWRPACTPCLNGHKVGIADLTRKLNNQGLTLADPEFAQAMQAAVQAGAIFAQNPMMALGQNGQRPDMISPVRPADVMVNGTSCCMICFQAQKETSILQAPGHWTPGA